MVLLCGECRHVGYAVQSILLSKDRRCRFNTDITADSFAPLLDNQYFVVDATLYGPRVFKSFRVTKESNQQQAEHRS